MTTGRNAVLGRIRHALAGIDAAETPDDVAVDRSFRHTGDLDEPQRLELFAERVSEYRATVHHCGPDEVASTVDQVCADHDVARLLVPAGLSDEWLPGELDVVVDDDLTVDTLDGVDGVITGCAVAIAATGTIVLDAGSTQGRRALTLVPDLHICVVHADQVVELVPRAVAVLAEAVRAGRPLTMISGPSATSDIELSRVEGVHGPRRLDVILVATEAG